MYNDTIKAENKIISNEKLYEIFQKMGETLKNYQKISMHEEQKNKMLDYAYQEYTFKDQGSKMKVAVDFYDNTNIIFDNYDTFISVFYSRIEEIKRLSVHYSLYYEVVTPSPNRTNNFYSQSITIDITENKLDISLKLNSQDPKLNEIYEMLKSMVLTAPEKYDVIIKKKSSILNIISFSSGMIPAIILTSSLLIVPSIREIIFKGYVIFPICVLFLSFIIGNITTSSKLEKYYSFIMPEKKYSGYSDGHAVYKDDVEKFVGTSEILIGKKVNNLKYRDNIKKEYEKHKKFLPGQLMILVIITIIIIAIGLFV